MLETNVDSQQPTTEASAQGSEPEALDKEVKQHGGEGGEVIQQHEEGGEGGGDSTAGSSIEAAEGERGAEDSCSGRV